jgi:hypothetical protein
VAMDVTWPEQPEFLWQRTFANLGATVATPAVGHARIHWSGYPTPIVRAVAILPGGQGKLDNSNPCPVDDNNHGRSLTDGRKEVRCWETLGRSLYVVDVATGELIQEFDARHFPSPLTGSVAVDSEGLSATRAAYFTDDDGVLWRLWMNDPDPSNWRVQPIWDLFAHKASLIGTTSAGLEIDAAPATELFKAGRTAPNAPVVTRDPATGNYTIMVGTGDPDQLGSAYPHRVVSLTETRSYNKDGSLAIGAMGSPWNRAGVKANWQLQLDPREAVTGPMTMFEDTLYFTSFRPPSPGVNQCAMGTSRIVGAHVRDVVGRAPKPMLVPEGASGPPYVLSYFPSQESSSLLLGMNISRDLVCVQGGEVVNDPVTGARMSGGTAGGGEYRMRMMVGGGSSPDTIIAGSASSGSQGLHQLQRTMPIQNVARSVGWANSIE